MTRLKSIQKVKLMVRNKLHSAGFVTKLTGASSWRAKKLNTLGTN